MAVLIRSCISCSDSPCVSGTRNITKKIATTEKIENAQKSINVPKASASIGKSFVITNATAQTKDEVNADAAPFTFGENNSAVRAHGKGPKPVNHNMFHCKESFHLYDYI